MLLLGKFLSSFLTYALLVIHTVITSVVFLNGQEICWPVLHLYNNSILKQFQNFSNLKGQILWYMINYNVQHCWVWEVAPSVYMASSPGVRSPSHWEQVSKRGAWAIEAGDCVRKKTWKGQAQVCQGGRTYNVKPYWKMLADLHNSPVFSPEITMTPLRPIPIWCCGLTVLRPSSWLS